MIQEEHANSAHGARVETQTLVPVVWGNGANRCATQDPKEHNET